MYPAAFLQIPCMVRTAAFRGEIEPEVLDAS